MYSRWTQHLQETDEKEAFKKEIYSAKRVLDRLKDILEEDEKALDRSEMDQRVYGIDNWSHLQAHKNGVRQQLFQLKNLINLDQQKGNINDHKLNG